MKKYIFLIIFIAGGIFFFVSCKNNEHKSMKTTPAETTLDTVDWSKNVNIYEVNIRQYTPEGTLNAFASHLPRLREMGVDIIWLMPVQPIGVLNRKGGLGSYYSIRDYKAINPEFGTMIDFKAMVDQAHSLGMYVILDWVANHSAWDNPLVEEHPDWYTKDDEGNLVSPYDWTDVVDFNYDNKALWDYMIGAMKFWVEEANIDGFRSDVAGEVPTPFWELARKELDKVKPVFMLAESELPEHHIKAYDMTYAWELHHTMNSIAKGEKTVEALWENFAKEDTLFPKKAYRMYFTSNHDENSWNGTEFERMGYGAQTFAVFTTVIPGMPLIYSGQEAAFNRRLEFFEKDQIDWGTYEYADFYKTLLELKHDNQALWNGIHGGEMIRIHTSAPEKVFTIYREKNGDGIFALLNLSAEPQEVTLHGTEYLGEYKEAFSGEEKAFSEEGEVITLAPWEFLVYTK